VSKYNDKEMELIVKQAEADIGCCAHEGLDCSVCPLEDTDEECSKMARRIMAEEKAGATQALKDSLAPMKQYIEVEPGQAQVVSISVASDGTSLTKRYPNGYLVEVTDSGNGIRIKETNSRGEVGTDISIDYGTWADIQNYHKILNKLQKGALGSDSKMYEIAEDLDE